MLRDIARSNSCFRPVARVVVCAVVALLALVPTAAHAAGDGAWPTYPLEGNKIDRGDGFYLSIFKLVLVWLVFLAWVKACDWLSRDTLALRQNALLWHSVCIAPFVLSFMLMLLIPVFAIGFLFLLIAFAAPIGTYVYHRNTLVEPHLRVLTPDHFRDIASRKARTVGVTIDLEKKEEHEKGPDIQLTADGGTSEENTANLYKCQQSPGYNTARSLIFDAVEHRGEAVRFDATSEAVAVRYQIDGVWHETSARHRDEGDLMLAVFKTLANLDARERRQQQSGKFGATIAGKNVRCRIASVGTETGERVVVQVDHTQAKFESLDDLGMSEKTAEALKEAMGAQKGFVLLSAPPAGGLRTTFARSLASTDRIMRDVVAVAEEGADFPDIENIQVTRFNNADGPNLTSAVDEVLSAYPNVVVVPDVRDGDVLATLSREAAGERLVISTNRGKDPADALLRVLATKVPPLEFAKGVSTVLFQRLVRPLCESCKVAYAPKPEVLKKLGIPEGRVKALYREPKEEERDEVCKNCQGIGFRGRTAIYELLTMTPELKKLLASGPNVDALRKAIQQSGHRALQTEGILLVAKGVTSLPELTRVLKQ